MEKMMTFRRIQYNYLFILQKQLYSKQGYRIVINFFVEWLKTATSDLNNR